MTVTLAGMGLWRPLHSWPVAEAADPLAALKAKFVRPRFVPHPADNPSSPERIALGKRLFDEKRLSATDAISCASCHDPRLAFTDGEVTGKGVTGRRLARHTPSLWNVAFSPLLFWDGRAKSLEDQVHFPVEQPDEMGSTLAAGAAKLSKDASYRAAFAAAFPQGPEISPANIARALAAYERTLISPPTPFDAWIAGQVDALSEPEVRGFKLFAGKARCISCHVGFELADHNFYDIGLPDDDKGRGREIDLRAADHAFKTPSLRELAWTAPYMHNGSLSTLEEVVRFYEGGGIDRPTRSKDLPAHMHLSDEERSDLLAFLDTLSSDAPPQPSTEAWVGGGRPPHPAPPAETSVVSQLDKTFTPAHVRLKAGQSLTVLNDDTRTHNVRIFDPKLDYNSGAQEPHESVTIRFPEAGLYEAFCGIHPSMRLQVEVK
ncbi:MAG TPA: cytochrome c peroxidase [Hyphomicrobiaceae bacterium]|nr:cytochrome c peroxidase [Hyphomicrobiaceae bacterium]